MGWRYRKSIPLSNWLRLNLSRRGPSVSATVPRTGLTWTSRGGCLDRALLLGFALSMTGCLGPVLIGLVALFLVGTCLPWSGSDTKETPKRPVARPAVSRPVEPPARLTGSAFPPTAPRPVSSTGVRAPLPVPASAPAASDRPLGGSDRVEVRGYYRKDGTYVRPHTRSRPSR